MGKTFLWKILESILDKFNGTVFYPDKVKSQIESEIYRVLQNIYRDYQFDIKLEATFNSMNKKILIYPRNDITRQILDGEILPKIYWGI